ncbi:hypothetical protein GmHk_14G040835 [Glycine max]|nr:hypothetical protein GmHk_14G040835 [Glycine max]
MPIKPDLKWPKEAWILGQDVSVGFTSTMYTVLFPHFWLPLCALLHTTASHPLPIAAICNFSNCIVIFFLGFSLNVIVSYTLNSLFKLLEILCNFNPSKLTLSNRSKISIRSPESSDKEIHACETNPKRNTNKIHRESKDPRNPNSRSVPCMPIKPDLKWPKEAWILGQDVFVGFTPTMYTVLFPHFWLPLCALLYTTAYHPLPIAAICNFSNCIGIPKIPLDHQRKIQLKKRLKLKLLKRKRMADFLAKNGEEEKAQ